MQKFILYNNYGDFMNTFFTDNFNISKINMCVLVKAGIGQNIHNNRPYHGLVIQKSGVKKYLFSTNEVMTVMPGELFYLPKFSSYEVVNVEDGDCIAINFELNDSLITYPHFKVYSKYYENYINDFEKFLKIWELQKSGYMNQCFKIIYNIICGIQQEKNQHYAPPKKRKIADDGKQYILENLSDPFLTVHSIADALGISPEYFRKIFREVYNISPKKYIVNKRIEKSKELILSQEFKISEISQICGFNDASFFSTEFKRITSYTPSEYIKAHV